MELLKNKKLILLTFLGILAVVIFFVILPKEKNNPQVVQSYKSATTDEIKSFISSYPMPVKSESVKRTAKDMDGYQVSSAASGNIDSPISFDIGGGKIAFTSIGNPNLGAMNKSDVIYDKDGSVTYENIYNGINLIYTPSKDKILEEYEVRAKREIEYLVQKIDIENLNYEKQSDGSIIFTNSQTNKFAFAVPKPVMYEKYNTKEKNFGLHYEIFDLDGNTYLAKVIDEDGNKWLTSRAKYPVMIDATILLTLFSYTSYPTVGNTWTINAQTVGSGDLIIKPTNGTTWNLSTSSDPDKDLNQFSLKCDDNNVAYQINSDNGAVFSNFSCDGNIIVSVNVTDPAKKNSLDFIYSGFTTKVESIVDDGKPIILSSSLNPSVVSVGDTLTITVEAASSKGISSATAEIVGIDKVSLALVNGDANHGTWQGSWKVRNTATKPYEVLITASDGTDTTQSSIGFFDPYTCLGGGDHAGSDWNPATDCASGAFAGEHTNIGTFNVSNGQTATVQAFDQATSYGIATVSASTVTVAGTVTATGKGWSGGSGTNDDGKGPGGGDSNLGNSGGGGGYGGAGGNGNGPVVGGITYGSLTQAGELGSGGGSYQGTGGAGGGVIKLMASGTLTVSGTVSSNGNTGGSSAGGGGSGGGIYLSGDTITGGGSVTANGGNAYSGFNPGGGGGGRIAIYYTTTNSFSGSVTTTGGTHFGTGTDGSVGTNFIEQTSGSRNMLIPSSNGIWNGSDRSSWSFGNLTINASVTFRSSNATLLTITSTGAATFASGITVTLRSSNTNNSNGAGVYLNLTGDVTIPSTSVITGTGYGYPGGGTSSAGSGPGASAGSGSASTAGAGYGGAGGSGNGGAASGGSTYGSNTIPIDPGSGAGSFTSNQGGAGGGAIRISTDGILRINGSLTANGGAGSGSSGGGAGGSIYLTVGDLRGSGTITALGGNSGSSNNPGGGGGGRVSLTCTNGENWANWSGTSFSAAVMTDGGTKNGTGVAGSDGTVYTSNCYEVNPKVGGTTRINGSVRFR